jgi:hypothetical protein
MVGMNDSVTETWWLELGWTFAADPHKLTGFVFLLSVVTRFWVRLDGGSRQLQLTPAVDSVSLKCILGL